MGLRFGDAMNAVQDNEIMTRGGWPEHTFLFLMEGGELGCPGGPLANKLGPGSVLEIKPHVMIARDDAVIEAYIPSQADIREADWFEVAR